MFRFSFSPSSAALPAHIYLYLSFPFFFQLLYFSPHVCLNFLFFFFRKYFSPLISILLFALYINEIGFFFSPMEDNHSSNCQLIVTFYSSVKRKIYERERESIKNSNALCLYLCILQASYLALPAISLFLLYVTFCSKSFFLKSGAEVLTYL